MISSDKKTSEVFGQSLGERFPDKFNGEQLIIFVTPEMTVQSICEELRKCHSRSCGMPHEDMSMNPSAKVCSDVGQSYNVACNHAEMSQRAFRLAYELGTILEKPLESLELFERYSNLYNALDDIDGKVRPLYCIANADSSKTTEYTASDLQRLAAHGVDTNVTVGDNALIRKRISAKQKDIGQRILSVRDEVVEFLETVGT